MVLSSNLYVTRPSLGFGIFYVEQSKTLILSPSVSGFLADIATRATSLVVSVPVVLSALPVAVLSRHLGATRQARSRSFGDTASKNKGSADLGDGSSPHDYIE